MCYQTYSRKCALEESSQRLFADAIVAELTIDSEDLTVENWQFTNEPEGLQLRGGRRRLERVSFASAHTRTGNQASRTESTQINQQVSGPVNEQVSMRRASDETQVDEEEITIPYGRGLDGTPNKHYLDIVLWMRAAKWIRERSWLTSTIECFSFPASSVAAHVSDGARSLLMRSSLQVQRQILGEQVLTAAAVGAVGRRRRRENAKRKAEQALRWTKVIAWITLVAQVTLFVGYLLDGRVARRLGEMLSGTVSQAEKGNNVSGATNVGPGETLGETVDKAIRQQSGHLVATTHQWSEHLFLIVTLVDLLLGRVRWRTHVKPAIKSALTARRAESPESEQMGDGSRAVQRERFSSCAALFNSTLASSSSSAVLLLEHLFELAFVCLLASGALEHASPFVELLHLSNQMALNLIQLARASFVEASLANGPARTQLDCSAGGEAAESDDGPPTGGYYVDGEAHYLATPQTSRRLLVAKTSDKLADAFQRLRLMRKLSLLGQLVSVEVTVIALLLQLDSMAADTCASECHTAGQVKVHTPQTDKDSNHPMGCCKVRLTDSMLVCAYLAVCFAAVYRFHNKYHMLFVEKQRATAERGNK